MQNEKAFLTLKTLFFQDLLEPTDPKRQEVEASLKKEKVDEVREVLSLVLAKVNLEDEDKNKRLESLDTIRKYGRIDFYRPLETLLERNEQGEFLESDPTVRAGAEKALASIKQRQFFVNQIANLFYG